ncbi:hypothetical protein LDY77_24890, partial [Serratia marcescens]|nr:hypothetical protein [Serratia marcescens]
SDAGSNEHLYPGRATEAGQDSQSIFWLMCIGFELTCVDAYAYKVVVSIVLLPLAIALVEWVKKIENTDHYDWGTSYNPFK